MKRTFGCIILFCLLSTSGLFSIAAAATKEELHAQIDQRSAQIQQLEKEIAETQANLSKTAQARQTLQTAVSTLDLTRKKVTANVQVAQTKITGKDAEILALNGNITDANNRIGSQRMAVANSIRELNRIDTDTNMLVSMLAGTNVSDLFSSGIALFSMRSAILGHVEKLSSLKATLVTTKSSTEEKRKELAGLKSELIGQQAILDANRKEKAVLLSTTKNKESAYQTQLKAKQALHSQFESDLLDFQAKLNLVVDPGSIPHSGTGVLTWPVAKPRITQYFGNTDFSTKNPQIYNGHGHSGIDFAASPGSSITAALSGTVKGTGDTDLTCPGASYGRWVLVEHNNGLSTLYAHLSVIRVSQGQNVSTGESVGYSGSTGYATGPHLHFAVFATQGTRIQQLPSKAIACKGKVYTMPVADLKAYLNPLSYL